MNSFYCELKTFFFSETSRLVEECLEPKHSKQCHTFFHAFSPVIPYSLP